MSSLGPVSSSLPSPQHAPPLPPRTQCHVDPPPAYDTLTLHHHDSSAVASNDPRSSSTESLLPRPDSERVGRRTLLLVYVHGFMGDETSFQSFPAHVHNLVTITLADTHLVHTKLYPKYRSRHTIDVARDAFSKWLAPHESPTTDVILLGHSMGGLLIADVALLPSSSPHAAYPLRHRIIGTVNFDTPFLGMHPGVVKSGLSSLFRSGDDPKPPPEAEAPRHGSVGQDRPGRTDTFFAPRPSDPNYNPAFSNDVRLPNRKPWESVLHFVSKHSDELFHATKASLTSHLKFGGAMADYSTLKERYAEIRALEEDDVRRRQTALSTVSFPPRVRFINYYTASTGRPKKPRSPSSSRPSSRAASDRNREDHKGRPESLAPTSTIDSHPSRTSSRSPRISVEEHRDNEIVPEPLDEPLSATSPVKPRETDDSPSHSEVESLVHHDPIPIGDSEGEEGTLTSPISLQSTPSMSTLPPIPDVPKEPPIVDFAQYADKDTRKLAEKEHARVVKDYKTAVKNRNATIRERAKLEQKLKKRAEKEEAKRNKFVRAEEAAQREILKQEEERRKHGQKEEEVVEREDSAAPTDEEPFSWERVWAADRAREARQRELEATSRQQGSPQSTAAPNNNRLAKDQGPEANIDKTSTFQASDHGQDPTTSTYDYSQADILDADSPQNRIDASDHAHYAHPDARAKQSKPKRYKKFCMLPPKDANGRKDPTWFRVFMEGVDEVGAHCGLFFVSDTYERLVGEVGARIEEWVREDMSLRAIREFEG